MKSKIIMGSLVLLSLGISCKIQKKDKTKNTDSETTITAQEITLIDASAVPPSSDITINSISLNGDILSIHTSYSGGCKKHEFNLFFNGNYMKSLPPKAQFILQHINNKDECRSLIDTTLKFNIAKAKYIGQSELMIRVNGFEKEINYKY